MYNTVYVRMYIMYLCIYYAYAYVVYNDVYACVHVFCTYVYVHKY